MAGATHFMMLDPHTPQLEGFIGMPVDSLKVRPVREDNLTNWLGNLGLILPRRRAVLGFMLPLDVGNKFPQLD